MTFGAEGFHGGGRDGIGGLTPRPSHQVVQAVPAVWEIQTAMTAGALREQSADGRQSFGASQTTGGLDGLCRVFRRFASGRAPTSSFLSSGVQGALRCKAPVGSRLCLWQSLELIAGRDDIRVQIGSAHV